MDLDNTSVNVNGTVIDTQSLMDSSGCPKEEIDVHAFLEAIAEELEPRKRLRIVVIEDE